MPSLEPFAKEVIMLLLSAVLSTVPAEKLSSTPAELGKELLLDMVVGSVMEMGVEETKCWGEARTMLHPEECEAGCV